jgi:hypothetical protein
MTATPLLDLNTLDPAATITLPVTHPETKVAFAAEVVGPYTEAGQLAAERLVALVREKGTITPEQDVAAAHDFAASILVGLPGVTVNGEPLTIASPAEARKLSQRLPYLAGQLVKQYLDILGFFSRPSGTSSPTSPTSESSAA